MKIDFNKLPKKINKELYDELVHLYLDKRNLWRENYLNLINVYDEELVREIRDKAVLIEREKARVRRANMGQEEKDDYNRGANKMRLTHGDDEYSFERLYCFVNKLEYLDEYSGYKFSDFKSDYKNVKDLKTPFSIRLFYTGKEDEEFHFFKDNHTFSIFLPRDLIIANNKFISIFHYLIYAKAEAYLNREKMNYILSISEVSELEKLHFTKLEIGIWNINLPHILKKVYSDIFNTEVDFRKELIETQGKTIAFMNELDSFWGIGLSLKDERRNQRNLWIGKNHLGEFLTVLRVQLTGEY